MYSHGQLVSASTATGAVTGATVVALPLTSGNVIFQSIIIATAIVALTALVVRIVKLIATRRMFIAQ